MVAASILNIVDVLLLISNLTYPQTVYYTLYLKIIVFNILFFFCNPKYIKPVMNNNKAI